MKSGGGVLCISSLQLVVGLILLGIYEGYKTKYFNDLSSSIAGSTATVTGESMHRSTLNMRFAMLLLHQSATLQCREDTQLSFSN